MDWNKHETGIIVLALVVHAGNEAVENVSEAASHLTSSKEEKREYVDQAYNLLEEAEKHPKTPISSPSKEQIKEHG